MKSTSLQLSSKTLSMLIFILIYFTSALILYLRIDLPNDIIRHLIWSLIGMTGLLVINVKFPAPLWSFFTFIAFTHYTFSSLSNIYFSLFRNNITAFESMGSLANTDSFIVFLVLAFSYFTEQCLSPKNIT
jgi:hypothetical protein